MIGGRVEETEWGPDDALLGDLLDGHYDELTEWEQGAFADMRAYLAKGRGRKLSDSQRSSVRLAHKRVLPKYENLVSRGLVPRGREVPVPEVLRNLPKKPPARRKKDGGQ